MIGHQHGHGSGHGSSSGHGHDGAETDPTGTPHGPSAAGRFRGRLAITFGLTAAFFVVELVVGLLSGSLALVADAGHMATDVVALGADGAPTAGTARKSSPPVSRCC